MRLMWPMLNDASFAIGNRAGYIFASTRLRDAVEALGVEITTDADTAVHFCHPKNFMPIPGKRNGLLTMCESARLARAFVAGFERADFVLTPSKFCRDIFAPYVKAKPLFVSPLGFDPEAYTPTARAWRPTPEIEARFPLLDRRIAQLTKYLRDKQGSRLYVDPTFDRTPVVMCEPYEPFIFVHVGAPNARKGPDRVVNAWSYVFRNEPWAQLVLKTSDENGAGKVVRVAHNVTFDSRFYRTDELRTLLASAHCFVGPSHGEGVGLLLLEALATGLPVVTVKWSGPLDFLDESCAFFARHTFDSIRDSEGEQFAGAFANVDDLARVMLRVVRNYPSALAKGERGARRAHARWTWTHAARALIENVERIEARLAA